MIVKNGVNITSLNALNKVLIYAGLSSTVEIVEMIVSCDDTIQRILNIYYFDGSTDYIVGSVVIPPSAGYNGISTVNILQRLRPTGETWNLNAGGFRCSLTTILNVGKTLTIVTKSQQ